jgi:hypothetical protein
MAESRKSPSPQELFARHGAATQAGPNTIKVISGVKLDPQRKTITISITNVQFPPGCELPSNFPKRLAFQLEGWKQVTEET